MRALFASWIHQPASITFHKCGFAATENFYAQLQQLISYVLPYQSSMSCMVTDEEIKEARAD